MVITTHVSIQFTAPVANDGTALSMGETPSNPQSGGNRWHLENQSRLDESRPTDLDLSGKPG